MTEDVTPTPPKRQKIYSEEKADILSRLPSDVVGVSLAKMLENMSLTALAETSKSSF